MNVGNVWFLAFLGPNELSVIERCPYYRGVLKERLDCIWMILVMGIPWFSDALIRRGNFYCSVIFEGCYMLDHYEMNFFFSLTSVDSWDSFSLSFSMKKLQTPDKPTTIHDLINCEFCQCLSDRNCKNSIYTWIHVIFILLSLHVLYWLDNPGFIKKIR